MSFGDKSRTDCLFLWITKRVIFPPVGRQARRHPEFISGSMQNNGDSEPSSE